MINLNRPREEPPTLSMQKVSDAKDKIHDIIESGAKPKSKEFNRHWGESDVREALWKMQNGKCCYCERKRDVNRESDIEHFRPKAEIAEEGPGKHAYWWLAYQWDNLFFSCRHCNQQYKKKQFPLRQGGVRAKGPDDKLEDEKQYLIDPAKEQPEDFIGFDWQSTNGMLVQPHGLDFAEGRGEKTIKVLGLRRTKLCEDRASLLKTLEGFVMKMHAGQVLGKEWYIDAAKRDIERETSANMCFTGFRRAFFRAAGLGEFISKD